MKKITAMLLGIMTLAAATGCGGKETAEKNSEYASAEEVLSAVADTYTEEQKFPIGGGDSANLTMDAPGKFDISKKEELVSSLSLPEGETEHIDDAASMIHMMNANLFTGAAYHLKEDVDAEEFAEAVKEEVLTKQWICGMPDTLIVLDAGGQYVIAAYGADEIIETFESNALSALEGAEVILNTPVME